MEDNFDAGNRLSFKNSIADPNLGYGNDIYDLKTKASIFNNFNTTNTNQN